jgi:hypothetical protein
MQPNSKTRIALKELRQLLDQQTLVQQYLQEIGLSWNCATNDSDTLRKLMNEQVMPLLDFFDGQSISNATAGLPIFGHIDADDEEEKHPRISHLSFPNWINNGPVRNTQHVNPHRTISLSTLPKYLLPSSTSPAQVSPFSANVLSTRAVPKDSSLSRSSSSYISDLGITSFSKTRDLNSQRILPANDFSSAPIAIQSQGSIYKLSSFASPWSLLSSENSSGGQGSSLIHNAQPSSQGSTSNIPPLSSLSLRSYSVSGYFGMLGGQTFGSVFRWFFQ